MKKNFLTIFLVTTLAIQPIAWNSASASVSKFKFQKLNSTLDLDRKISIEDTDLTDESYADLTSEKVIAVIEALPEVDDITLKDEKAVVKARKLVMIFNDDSAITNLNKLLEAENRITQLKEDTTDKAQKDKELAAINSIESLPEIDALTLEDEKAVINARELVSIANNDAAITNLNKLIEAENRITQLKEAKANEEQRNKELAAINSIEALPAIDSLTLEDEKAVINARELVSISNNDAAITNLNKLIAAEAKIAELKANKDAIRDDKDNCNDRSEKPKGPENNRKPNNNRNNSRGENRNNGRGGDKGHRNMGQSANRGGRR
ncbi:hypothetical protein [Clostridium sp.]|uniref:hypothetical protein n=1 Tax=Clostridium sp. TaxID=1506 RepID=UPI002907ECE4|nr:hypothetical protein [Clostridium sp.]MDU5108717.1 hypothetical protein [Clostridium sp.]